MKILEKTALYIFSIIILILSVVAIFLSFKWVNPATVFNAILGAIQNYRNIVLAISIIFILLAIKVMFFGNSNSEKEEQSEGVLLENSEGKLLISKTTIENLVNKVVSGFDSAAKARTRIDLDETNNVTVYVDLAIKENAVIKELSNNLQIKIKEAIKKSSDLDVKEVNISVRNIENENKENAEQ